MSKGLYIALEGMDGVGKSTVMPYISDYLKSIGRDVVEVREPGSTPLGERIRELLKSDCPMDATSELLLMLTARHQLFKDVVRPALADGKVVLTDRCYISSYAYQCKGGMVNPFLADALHRDLCLRPYIDYVFILQKPFDEAIKAQSDADRFEYSLSYQGRVARFYEDEGRELLDFRSYRKVFTIQVDKNVKKTAKSIISKLDI